MTSTSHFALVLHVLPISSFIILIKLSDNADVEECYLLGSDSVYYISNMSNFQAILLPASSSVSYHEDGSSKPN